MGRYFNPGNFGFQEALNSLIYVDKTGIIGFVNSVLNTKQKFMTVSRARRFGKSMATELLAAYYSKGCDSRELFKGLKAETLPTFEKELNKNNVIFFDFQAFWGRSKLDHEENRVLEFIQRSVISELHESYPGLVSEKETNLPEALNRINASTNEQFIVIIDEWDCIFREGKDKITLQKEYINFLRSMFKGTDAEHSIKLAYLTGILPIKKYGTQSALNNFKDYTMVRPCQMAEYVGFTEEEVKGLCERFDMDFEECRRWYDGYSFENAKSIYNPNSVVEAMFSHEFGSYWTKTDTYKVLSEYISLNFDGLRDDIITMLGGGACRVTPDKFQNDMVSINSKDDAMTLLVHLGYLAYNSSTGKAKIPNGEIAAEFAIAVEDKKYWGEIANALEKSEDLLDAVMEGNSDFVAHQLSLVHSDSSSILTYNNENSLACAVTIAFYTAFKYYSVFRELDSGKGFADMVYIPRPGCDRSALLIELKYNKDADSAIRQIKEKRYSGRLSHYNGNILLIGINYDKESKQHSCVIENLEGQKL